MRPATLIQVLDGDVALIDTDAAAVAMGVSLRRFHQLRANKDPRVPAPTICHGRIVRYLDSDFSL